MTKKERNISENLLNIATGLKKLFLACLILIYGCATMTGCHPKYDPPIVPECVFLESGELFCIDYNLPEDEREYFRELVPGDIVIDLDSRNKLEDWADENRKERIKCED